MFGAGGGISFLYQKSTFPFFGGRSANLREAALDTLGLKWLVERPGKDDSRWEKIVDYSFDWRTVADKSDEFLFP